MRIIYEGPADTAPVAAALLAQEGFEVSQDVAVETRSSLMSNPVVVYFAIKLADKVTEAARDAAIERVRSKLAERFPEAKLFRDR